MEGTSAAAQEKRAAAEAAALLAEDGMTLGLGTGTTVAYLLEALARRHLDVRCVATSPRTAAAAADLGLAVAPFEEQVRLDLAIDGADQVAPDGWLIKGGGAAHTREKLVAVAAERFVVVVDSSKVVDALVPPVPLELLAFGLASTLGRLGQARVRPGVPPSPDGGVICDWYGPCHDPSALSRHLEATPGVVGHGLFPPDMVSLVLTAHGDRVTAWEPPAGASSDPV